MKNLSFSPGRSRAGFTLLEMLISLLVGGTVLTVVFQLAALLQTQRQLTRERSATVASGLQVRTSLARSLEEAGTGMIAAPNWSAVQVIPATTAQGDRDTLTVFYARGPQVRNSAQPCSLSNQPDCLRLSTTPGVSYGVGDLLVVGNALTGARVVQVSQILGTVLMDCGANCEEYQSCSTLAGTLQNAPVVTGSRRYDPLGNMTTSTSPCEQSFWPDGSRCEEDVASQAVVQTSSPACTMATPPSRSYTEMLVQNRTAIPFGYPEMPTFTYLSGGDGSPRITTQKVGFSRYVISGGETSRPSLLKQINLTPAGTFGIGIPVSSDVLGFRADVLHRGETDYVRGVGVTESMLSLSSGNSNLVSNSTPGTSGLAESRTFRRSYQSMSAVRVLFTIRSRRPLDPKGPEHEVNTFRLVASTPAILEGGATPIAP